ncbi:hypothetical protein ACCI51_19165 [Microbulbifer echini]|uniref:DUF4157 domain-containing protein n=1 Tax=Microbulbifer echini TaxID=1529067 RepID=A0ABV4NTA9_9GAMM
MAQLQYRLLFFYQASRIEKMPLLQILWRKCCYACFAMLVLVLSTGCDNFSPLEGHSPVEDEFSKLAADERILFKPGMEENALLVQKILDDQIKLIEGVHDKPFSKKVTVHICDTRECFNSYTGLKGGILAAVTSNGLFLSSYVISNEDYPIWLAHELSHLHLFQQVSIFKATFIPQWYHDGLAAFASKGGGATRVSKEQALASIRSGNHIVAADKGAFFSTRWPLNYPPSEDAWTQQHMNYRQASLFYEFIHPRGGIKLLRAIEHGEKFGNAFLSVYGKTPEEMFRQFKAEISPNESQ